MAKKDNRKITATPEQLIQADKLRAARQHAAEWGEWGDAAKDQLRTSVGGETDVTIVEYIEDGAGNSTEIEVASITESNPSQAVDWKAFRAAHPELEAEIKKFLKPATTSVTVRTSYVKRPDPLSPEQIAESEKFGDL